MRLLEGGTPRFSPRHLPFQTVSSEACGHILCMLDADTKAQCPHAGWVGHNVTQRLQNLARAKIIASVERAQGSCVISLSFPLQLTKIDVVCNPKILEGAQQSLLECIPQPKFDRNSVTKPVKNVLGIRSLWRGSEAQEKARLKMLQQPTIGRCRCMMKLIDDDDVVFLPAV